MAIISKIVSALTNISTQLQIVLIAIGVLCFIIGAISFASGGQEGFPKAKFWFKGAIGGVALGLMSKGIIEFVKTIFGGF